MIDRDKFLSATVNTYCFWIAILETGYVMVNEWSDLLDKLFAGIVVLLGRLLLLGELDLESRLVVVNSLCDHFCRYVVKLLIDRDLRQNALLTGNCVLIYALKLF